MYLHHGYIHMFPQKEKRKYTVTMSALKNTIDYKNLEEELRAAIAADELHKLQNDAKIRAVEQGVPTYEHFRQMVNGAHLKPLDRDDMKPIVGAQWNPMVNNNRSITCANFKKLECNEKDYKNIMQKKTSPETRERFLQVWRTIVDCSERFTYIWNQRDILRTIFRIEIPASFLSDFMDVCSQYLSNVDDVTSILEILTILSTCNRFDLTVCFMTKNEQYKCEQFFQQLRLKNKLQDSLSENIIKSLAVKYQIKLI